MKRILLITIETVAVIAALSLVIYGLYCALCVGGR